LLRSEVRKTALLKWRETITTERHIRLLVEYRDGNPCREPVHAVDLGDRRFRLLHSPGFVLGIAAGDELRLLDEDGNFEVICRSGNIAVQVFSQYPVDPVVEEATRRVTEIGGVLDGRIERAMVFSIPLQAGFLAIDDLFNALVRDHPEMVWLYGNVNDPIDGVTPLNWWISAK
jgi:Domain of unknown function (DUF4265)